MKQDLWWIEGDFNGYDGSSFLTEINHHGKLCFTLNMLL